MSQAFEYASIAGRSDKVLIARFEVSESETIGVSTCPVSIDGVQYQGVLRDIPSFSSTWNIQSEGNNVVEGAPEIHIRNKSFPDGSDLIQTFAQKNVRGKRCQVLLGYDGLPLEDYLPMFRGRVDRVLFSGDTIQFSLRTHEIPPLDINGRRIDSEAGRIGSTEVSNIAAEMHGKRVPVVFGDVHFSPARYYRNTNDYHVFAMQDYLYLSDMVTDSNDLRFWYQPSKRMDPGVYVADGDGLVPCSRVGWMGGHAELVREVAGNVHELKVVRPDLLGNEVDQYTNDLTRVSIAIPIGFEFLDGKYYLVVTGDSDPEADIEKIIDGTALSNVTFKTGANDNSNKGIWINAKVKSFIDYFGHERLLSAIRMPANRTIQICGRVETELDAFQDDRYRIQIALFKGAAIDINTICPFRRSEYTGAIPLLGVCVHDTMHHNVLNSNVNNYGDGNPGELFEDSKSRDLKYGWFDENELKSFADSDWLLNGLAKNYARIMISVKGTFAPTITAHELYLVVFGSVDFDKSKDPFYTTFRGVRVNGNNYTSAPNETVCQLRSPVQYLEAMIAHGGGVVGNEWASNGFASVFGSMRDYSGFTLYDEVTLKDFAKEYIKGESFTLYVDTFGKYRLPHLKSTYTETDIDGTLDYHDARKFTIAQSLDNMLRAEIKALKTGFIQGLGKYEVEGHWKLDENEYDYGYYDAENNEVNNRFFLKEIEKKYTSATRVSRVRTGTAGNYKYWGCNRTVLNSTLHPSEDPAHWSELAKGMIGFTTDVDWVEGKNYYGEDSENYAISSFYLNQWANLHNIIEFETTNLSYARFEIGDVVDISNCPFSLNGWNVRGFNGATNWYYTENGQRRYGAFIVYSVRQGKSNVLIRALQLHDLRAYSVLSKGIPGLDSTNDEATGTPK